MSLCTKSVQFSEKPNLRDCKLAALLSFAIGLGRASVNDGIR